MFEFENGYNLNTGDLLQIFQASGIHFKKDVTLNFSFIDPVGKVIDTDVELRDNPLIKDIEYDILDTNGNVLYENYFVGLSRSLTITELDNIALFGEYKKDFGIRAIVSNYINENKFVSEYYVYGNIPEIYSVQVYDGSGQKNYFKYNFWDFKINSGNLTNFYVSTIDSKDIEIDWGDTQPNSTLISNSNTGHLYIENTGINYDTIKINIDLLNNPKYIEYDYIDIYAGLSNSGIININQSNFLYRENFSNIDNQLFIEIGKEYIQYDQYYDFIIVPYSKLGSGNHYYIGPHIIIKSEETLNAEITVEPVDTFEKGSFEELNLIKNGLDLKFNLINGSIDGTSGIIDIIDKNLPYRTYKYLSQIIDKENKATSSELKLTITDTGKMPILTEYGIEFTDNNINYILESTQSYIYLKASNINYPAQYKIYKTSM
jgi:hypothetical protein